MPGHVQKRQKMGQLAVNTSVGNEPHEMKFRIIFFYPFHELADGIILKKTAICNTLVDSQKILIDDPTGTDVQMAYFGISHDLVGQSHSVSKC